MKFSEAFASSLPQPLTAEIAARNRFNWSSRVDINELARTLDQFPGRSQWVPDADELLVVSPWRNRLDIAAVSQVSSVLHVDKLIGAGRAASFRLGADAFVMPEWNETRPTGFYARNGLELLEDVISFETEASQVALREDRSRTARRLMTVDSDLLDTIMAIDHAAFPWLWRNSRLEFEHYLYTPGVEIWALAALDGTIVSYIGITAYAGWGHLDRVAVDPDWQGQGHGEYAVRFAVGRLRVLGCRRVGLSTQRTNLRSQRLYNRLGFRQTWQNDYRIYGTLAGDTPAGNC